MKTITPEINTIEIPILEKISPNNNPIIKKMIPITKAEKITSKKSIIFTGTKNNAIMMLDKIFLRKIW